MKQLHLLFTALFTSALFMSFTPASAQGNRPPGANYPKPPDYQEPTQAQLESLIVNDTERQWFDEAKLGIAIHWGPVTLTGVPMSWGRDGPRPGAGRKAKNGVPRAEYDQLYRRFNASKFDASQWMDAIAGSGAKYFFITAKHHDGFAMWDTKTTDYNIMNSPLGRDVVGELATAAQERDIKTFWYYSQPDWFHPNALQKGHYEKYLPYMKAQLDELLTKYGRVDGIWFDNLGSKWYHWDSANLLPHLRKLQPGLIINERIGHRLPEQYRGDFETYELSVGPYDEPRTWESIITLSKAWAWHGGDLTKSPDATLRLFLQVVGNGGNLNLNIAPQPNGEIFAADKKVLAHLGEYLGRHGEAVYGTRKGLYRAGMWGSSTVKGNTLYLHILQQTDREVLDIKLPALPAAPASIELMTPGKLASDMSDGLALSISGRPDNAPSLVKIVFDELPETPEPVTTFDTSRKIPVAALEASSERNKKFGARVLTGESGRGVFGEGVHIKTWWNPAKNDKRPSLTARFAEPVAVADMVISESIRSYAVTGFTVSYHSNDGNWHKIFDGSSIGEALGVQLDTPETIAIRVDFHQFEDDVPAITGIDFFGP